MRQHREARLKHKDISVQVAGMTCGCDRCRTEPAGHRKGADLARRRFLCNAIAGTAVVLAGATVMCARPVLAQSALTADEALKTLIDGNERYVAGQLQSLNEDLSILKAKTAEKQEPFAAVLSCADSRVPVEFVFDQSIGQLFVVRVAGNVTTPVERQQRISPVNAVKDYVEGRALVAGRAGSGLAISRSPREAGFVSPSVPSSVSR
jgi:carbonic anhydrase